MAEGNNSDINMDFVAGTPPSTELAVPTQESQETTNRGVTIVSEQKQQNHLTVHGTYIADATINGGFHLVMPAGPALEQLEAKTKQIERELEKRIDDKMDQHKDEMAKKSDLQKIDDKIGDLNSKFQIVVDEVRNSRSEQRLDTNYLCGLLQDLLQVQNQTKHKVESLGFRNDLAEAMSKLRAEVQETGTSIQGELAKIESSQKEMNYTVETNSEEAKRQRTQLQINQEQIWSTIVFIEQQMHSQLEKVEWMCSQESGSSVVALKPEFSDTLETLKSQMKTPWIVANYLYQAGAISDQEKEKLNDITNPRDKVQRLVEFLNLKDDGFPNLMDALKQDKQDAIVRQCQIRYNSYLR